MNKILIVVLLISILLIELAFSCTTAIVSGKYTVDGRPLLYKNRDTGFAQNKLMYFTDGKFDYIGTVNSADSIGKEVWAGFNSAGFGIMNSEAYNLNVGDTTKLKDCEGVLMKKALQECATLSDFETFLDNYVTPRGVRANFGVIDANGGAAYYETGHFTWEKFDVNDPALAPFGYLIRTNFAFSGVQDRGYGYIRYQNAENLFYQAAAEQNLNYKFILQDVSRSLTHSLTGTNLSHIKSSTGFVGFEDYIPRYYSASATVVQGVRTNEDPALTTFWTMLGFPLCTITIPTWLNNNNYLPSVMISDKSGNAPICAMALQLKSKCFPVTRGSGEKYIYLPVVINYKSTGILQQIIPVEDVILKRAESLQSDLFKNGSDPDRIKEFYDWVDKTIRKHYTDLLKM